jgi:hypothetical protein
MILERLEKLEDKMSLVLHNLKDKSGLCYVITMKTKGLTNENLRFVQKYLETFFDTQLIFFGEEVIQMIVHNNKYLIMLDDVMKSLYEKHQIRVGHVGIENEFKLVENSCIYNDNTLFTITPKK